MRKRSLVAGVVAAMLTVAALATPAHAGGTFRTKVNLNLRTCQWLNEPVCTPVKVVIPGGTWIYLNCWATGTSINGDSVWYNAFYGSHSGMLSGYYMETGHDPNPAVGGCI